MPQAIKKASAYKKEEEFIFPQDQEALKENPNHDPCKIWVAGELTDEQFDEIADATGRSRIGEDGKVEFYNSVFSLDGAVMRTVLSQPTTRWNLVDAEGDDIPVSYANWIKHVATEDRRPLREEIAGYYLPQILNLQIAEPTNEDLENEDPTSEKSRKRTSKGDSDSNS